LSSPTVSTKLARIAEQSKRDAALVFTTLAHLMDEDFLTEAFYQLRKDAAAGIDKMTVSEYEIGLEGRIADLHRRLVAREYRAQPARRVWIPKADGGQRGLAILVLVTGRFKRDHPGSKMVLFGGSKSPTWGFRLWV